MGLTDIWLPWRTRYHLKLNFSTQSLCAPESDLPASAVEVSGSSRLCYSGVMASGCLIKSTKAVAERGRWRSWR